MSGPSAESIVSTLVRSPRGIPWESHRLYHGTLRAPGDSARIDEVLAVVMRAPRSYTRETVAEIHCHGGSVVASLVVEACLELGARTARAGEFTLRAFLAGRLDLAQAEAVLSLVQAQTRAGARLAAEGLAGRLSREVARVREALLEGMVRLEAEIDFGDEIPAVDPEEVERLVSGGLRAVEALLAGAEEGRLRSEGMHTVLLGPPNAGKSTLLNRLLGEDRALVTPVPGTTRDRIEERAVVEGFCLRLVDTAGLHDNPGPVEALGMARAREALGRAECVVVVLDGSGDWPAASGELVEASAGRPAVLVLNKRDLGARLSRADVEVRFPGAEVVEVSLLDEGGAEEVKRALGRVMGRASGARAGEVYSTTLRQVEALRRCRSHLDEVRTALETGMTVDCQAGDLRLAVQALGEVTGQDVTEEVLDGIFSSFCLGK